MVSPFLLRLCTGFYTTLPGGAVGLWLSGFAEAIVRPWFPTDGSPASAVRRECAALPTLDSQQPCERSGRELPYSRVFVLPLVWLLQPRSNTTGSQSDASRQRFWAQPGRGALPIRTRAFVRQPRTACAGPSVDGEAVWRATLGFADEERDFLG